MANNNELDTVGIPGFSNYSVSSSGEIFSDRQGSRKCLKLDNSMGYSRIVIVGDDGNKRKLLVHRLVADAFIPNSDKTKIIVNHKNGNKLDNRCENLEWCTYSENLNHAYNNLYRPLPNAKLTHEDVLVMRVLRAMGTPIKELTERFGVSHSTVSETGNLCTK